MSKYTVDPETYERIKKWDQIHVAQCQNLGCMAEVFMASPGGNCPRCMCMIPATVIKRISLDDIEAKPIEYTDITVDDLEVYIDGFHAAVLLDITEWWRPIKLFHLETGDVWEDMYHSMRYGMAEADESREIAKQIEEGTYIENNLDFLSGVVKQFGFNLVIEEAEI